ncbi:Secreted protein containing DUF1080 [Planctomycetales bacterium 10988]|nr:Secreted protein containing DUF1080 [Planctomycetales bacterium 10988]
MSKLSTSIYLKIAFIVSLLVFQTNIINHAFSAEKMAESGEWIQLFNGKDLDDWNIKFTGCPLDENYNNTFQVNDGLLQVNYDEYKDFGKRFGHIIYKTPFSHYRIRVEYRFIGNQSPGGPGWAFRNSGIMLHGQTPESMTIDQDFPHSIEVQLLGGNGKKPRSTANLCTPGTHVVMDGKLFTPHCTNSTSKTYHGDQWVTVEVEVHGSDRIRHLIDGEVVLEYTDPQLDEEVAPGQPLNKRLLKEGYISLQAESHPCEFRKVELLPLNIPADSAE